LASRAFIADPIPNGANRFGRIFPFGPEIRPVFGVNSNCLLRGPSALATDDRGESVAALNQRHERSRTAQVERGPKMAVATNNCHAMGYAERNPSSQEKKAKHERRQRAKG
jgi:hypothetical protein